MSDHDDIIGTKAKTGIKHEPTERNRVMVRQMARVGIPPQYIAKELGIGIDTLRRHYGDVLEGATIQAYNKVLNTLYRKAVAGEQWAIEKFLGRNVDWMRAEWSPPKVADQSDATTVNVHLDAVGAISALLNQVKRGDPIEEAVLIEHKEIDDA